MILNYSFQFAISSSCLFIISHTLAKLVHRGKHLSQFLQRLELGGYVLLSADEKIYTV